MLPQAALFTLAALPKWTWEELERADPGFYFKASDHQMLPVYPFRSETWGRGSSQRVDSGVRNSSVSAMSDK